MKEKIIELYGLLTRSKLTFLLGVSGMMLVVLAALQLVSFFHTFSFSGNINKILVSLSYAVFGFMAIAIAIEKATDLYQIQKSLKEQTKATEKINDAIRRLNVYESLDSKKEIYDSSLDLAS